MKRVVFRLAQGLTRAAAGALALIGKNVPMSLAKSIPTRLVKSVPANPAKSASMIFAKGIAGGLSKSTAPIAASIVAASASVSARVNAAVGLAKDMRDKTRVLTGARAQSRAGRAEMRAIKRARFFARLTAALDEAKRRDEATSALALQLWLIGWVVMPAAATLLVIIVCYWGLPPQALQNPDALWEMAKISASRAWEDGWAISTGSLSVFESFALGTGLAAVAALMATPIALTLWAPFSGLCGLVSGWGKWRGSLEAAAFNEKEKAAQNNMERHQERAQLWVEAQEGIQASRRLVALEGAAPEEKPQRKARRL